MIGNRLDLSEETDKENGKSIMIPKLPLFLFHLKYDFKKNGCQKVFICFKSSWVCFCYFFCWFICEILNVDKVDLKIKMMYIPFFLNDLILLRMFVCVFRQQFQCQGFFSILRNSRFLYKSLWSMTNKLILQNEKKCLFAWISE